jgi:hypothetical protein
VAQLNFEDAVMKKQDTEYSNALVAVNTHRRAKRPWVAPAFTQETGVKFRETANSKIGGSESDGFGAFS